MTTAAVVGGGPAGLMAAEVLARAGVTVTVYDSMPSVGRKFMLAGHGGLNITHTEERSAFVARYGNSADRLEPTLDEFGPQQLRDWCADLGEPTIVGSSGRVFPKSFRATPLMRAWLARLAELGVVLERRRRWTGWSTAGLDFEGAQVRADVTLFALGGASWPHLGSDGAWVDLFAARGVEVRPLGAANVGVFVAWSTLFADRFEGAPLKNVSLIVRGARPVRGDAMVTRTGLEGGPVYSLGAAIRDGLDADGRCLIEVDLRPDLSRERLAERLAQRRPKSSGSDWLRRSIGLEPVGIALLRESAGGALPSDPSQTAALVKRVPVLVTGTMPIKRAISTAGGIAWAEVDDSLMLRTMPGTFVAGEMLDWEAPTGGYLLQAAFSTGVVAAHGALAWLSTSSEPKRGVTLGADSPRGVISPNSPRSGMKQG
jgi:uncharacterized flavoprotein (TIGR03862 family)